MVFGRKMFGGSRPNSADTTSDDVSTEYVPLKVIPQFVLEKHPELALREYNLALPGVCSNVIAVPHNACRLEMADMWGDIIPSLESKTSVSEEDLLDLRRWWSGFARFALTTSMVDDLVVNTAIGDIFKDLDKEALNLEKAVRKIENKNAISLERVFRAMESAIEEFENIENVISAWANLSATLCDIYALVEKTLDAIDEWRRGEIAEHKDLERKVASVYTNKKRWGEDSKRGEMIVVLTRWMGSEDMMRTWMKHNLGKKELKSSGRWMDDYRAGRLHLLDGFNKSLR